MIEKFDKTTRIIIGAALAIVIWITGIIIGQEQTVLILNPEGGFKSIITRTRVIKVSLMLDYGNGGVEVYPEMRINYGDSVIKILESANRLENNKLDLQYQQDRITGEISTLSISGYQSFPNDKQWLVWLNNNLQTDNLDKILLKAGDVVELKYIKLIQ